MENVIKWIAAIGGGIASFLFGGWDASLTALVVFVTFDYISGVLAAAKEGRLDSNVGFWGLARKVMMFVLVAIAYQIDIKVSGGNYPVLRDGAALWFVANEGLSILENAKRLGVKIPPAVQRALKNFQKGDKHGQGRN